MLLWQRRLKCLRINCVSIFLLRFLHWVGRWLFYATMLKEYWDWMLYSIWFSKKWILSILIMITILFNIGQLLWNFHTFRHDLILKISITASKYFNLLRYAKNTRYKISLSCKKIDYYTYEKVVSLHIKMETSARNSKTNILFGGM